MAGLPPISLSPRKLPANGLFLMPIQRIIPPILANVWFGWARRHLTLSTSAISGIEYNILIEAYAGHGALVIDGGPVPFGVNRVPETPAEQVTIRGTTFGIWREELYQLALDFSTLLDLCLHIDPLSLRVAEISQGLMDATMLVDPELQEAEYLSSVQLARERLRPLLECKNGSTTPVLYAFGHAHIDIAWLWPLAETERKIARTIANQLGLFIEYPDFRFLQSQPHLYQMLKDRYPDLYERIRLAIQAGQVIPDGAMWVEADTNISGGESLVRQIIHG
jgi:alpha-mannosidase